MEVPAQLLVIVQKRMDKSVINLHVLAFHLNTRYLGLFEMTVGNDFEHAFYSVVRFKAGGVSDLFCRLFTHVFPLFGSSRLHVSSINNNIQAMPQFANHLQFLGAVRPVALAGVQWVNHYQYHTYDESGTVGTEPIALRCIIGLDPIGLHVC